MSTESDRWLRRFHPAPGAPARLLCLPHAGGSASYFFPVSKATHPRVDVLVAQYPGRQDRRQEPLLESVADLADGVAAALGAYQDKPLTLFGHSMGASVAFEVALRLQALGTPVRGVVVSGRRAPSALRDESSHLLPDDELLEDVKALGGTEAALLDDPDIRQMVFPAIRADYKAAETYRRTDGPRIAAPITALIGDSDAKVTEPEARRWADHTDGDFELEVFTGGHFYITAHAAAVTARIEKQIGATLD
ncbi:alpha/beta fold hydrolase [Actinokineospora auranticolor]|uniref:Surfactin synthase thioesterase subunit n=1 Tax=Actinokineospora auranticolor TaxID=155976 RepID=A0A2S6GFW5_9PSEU|nr:alpha/beta fold hydrolase [Actinokineospora auranticolor]PPK64085.1 surfactin synthase thioesterase subunit [Actinokineospora auranticolor]